MDNLSIKLLDRLTEKALENASQEQRLAFVEKLFAEMPPAAQQEFLLKLARLFTNGASGTQQLEMALGGEGCSPRLIQVMRRPDDTSPWQACCQVMDEFVCSSEPAQLEATAVARMFSGLADETRLQIVKLLAKSEATVEELVAALDIAQSTVSHHLRVLREANLIRGERRGRNISYALVHPLDKDSTTAPEA